MKRSLVAPLILIALGAAFLFNNLRPEWNLFEFAATYWPFLLIAMGTLRLVEILAYAAAGKPLPAKGLSGGEIFLVTLVVIIGTGMFQVHSRFDRFGHFSGRLGERTIAILGESYDYPVSQQQAIPEKARILFDNVRGNIRITGGEGNELRISGRKTVRAYNRIDADAIHDKSPIEILTEGDRVIVRTNQERVSQNRQITTELDITAPKGVSIEGRGRAGDFEITGIAGAVEIVSESSSVRLSRIGGSTRVDVRRSGLVRAVDVAGPVDVTGRGSDVEIENAQGPVTVNGAFGGSLEFKNLAKTLHVDSRNSDLRIERLPGRLSMDLASLTGYNLVGPVTLTTSSKDVKLEDFTQSLQLEVDRGDVELRPRLLPLAKMDVRVRNVGKIDLILPAQARFDLEAISDKGEVESDYGAPITVDSSGRSSTLRGSTGGGAAIRLFTARGTIAVRKDGAVKAEKE